MDEMSFDAHRSRPCAHRIHSSAVIKSARSAISNENTAMRIGIVVVRGQ